LGKLWINDHATSLFFEFNPNNGQIKKYSTSLPSTRNNTSSLPFIMNIEKEKYGLIYMKETQ